MSPEILLYIIVGVVVFEFALEQVLSYLNYSYWKPTLPEQLSGIYDQEKYIKAQEYAFAKEKLAKIASIFSFVLILIWLLSGGFAWLDAFLTDKLGNSIWVSMAFFAIYAFASDLISLPFEWYANFVIEQKFGFNKMTPTTFWTDKLKGWLLGGLLVGILLYVFLWLYKSVGEYFWLYAWVVFVGFSFLLTKFYTTFIVPLFNKITPLPSGELRTAIEEYARSIDFPLANIMVIDGSKRSTKANAYFSGFGKTKTIVLYDTLIEKHSVPELVAVLAHEVGHYKKKHVIQSFIISAFNMLLVLYLLKITVNYPVLSEALGSNQPKIHLGLTVFAILYSPLLTLTGLLFNVFSRKNEFEADAYACKTASGVALANALKKLSVDTLSNLNPHPAYVFFYYSHPPLLKRLENINQHTTPPKLGA